MVHGMTEIMNDLMRMQRFRELTNRLSPARFPSPGPSPPARIKSRPLPVPPVPESPPDVRVTVYRAGRKKSRDPPSFAISEPTQELDYSQPEEELIIVERNIIFEDLEFLQEDEPTPDSRLATDIPVSPHPEIPVSSPTDVPVSPPTDIPVSPPSDIPVSPPTEIPVSPPAGIPVSPPTDIPVSPPTDIPVYPPIDSPVISPTGVRVVPGTDSRQNTNPGGIDSGNSENTMHSPLSRSVSVTLGEPEIPKSRPPDFVTPRPSVDGPSLVLYSPLGSSDSLGPVPPPILPGPSSPLYLDPSKSADLNEQIRSTTELCAQFRLQLQEDAAAISVQRAQLEEDIAAHRRALEEHQREVEVVRLHSGKDHEPEIEGHSGESEMEVIKLHSRDGEIARAVADVRAQADAAIEAINEIVGEVREWAKERKGARWDLSEELRRAREVCASLAGRIDEVSEIQARNNGADFDIGGLESQVKNAVDVLQSLGGSLRIGGS
jgi:hypothetical protein